MKNYLILAIVLFGLSAQAQDININFTANKTIDEVIAINLTTNKSITLPGDATLVLHPLATGVNELEIENAIWVAPNPYNSCTSLHMRNNKLQKVKILMTNMAGRILDQYEKELNIGIHTFQIAAERSGVYLLSVKMESGINCLKIIQTQTGQNKIEYMGRVEPIPTILKSASADYVLNYTPGDIISYAITSGDFTTIINETPTESKTITVEFVECKDADENNYPVVKIGNQWWMAENLKSTHYPNGTAIPHVTDNTDDAYCFYNNDAGLGYGALYTYAAAVNGIPYDGTNSVQGVCPAGWHLPSDDEWKELEMFLGMSESEANSYGWRGTDEGTKLKAKSGWYNNGNGTDEYGFTALPGGYYFNGSFGYARGNGYWWSSTEGHSFDAWCRVLYYYGAYVDRNYINKFYGFSVRCLRD